MLTQEALQHRAVHKGNGADAERRRNPRNKAAEFTGWQFPNLDFDGGSLLIPFYAYQSGTSRWLSRKGVELIVPGSCSGRYQSAAAAGQLPVQGQAGQMCAANRYPYRVGLFDACPTLKRGSFRRSVRR